MKHANHKRELRIRPLSEGIGLGTVRSVSHKVPKVVEHQSADQQRRHEPVVLRQAHAAYQPQSVAAEMRRRSSSQWYVLMSRFVAGVGADLFVGSFSIFVLSWAGILAWNAGSTGVFNPLESLIAFTDILEKLSLVKVAIGTVTAAIVWRAFRVLILSQRSV